MSFRGVFLLGFFVFALLATPVNPFWGILAYLGHYFLWPDQQWWGQALAQTGLRVSLTISILTGLAMLIHWDKWASRITTGMFHSQEAILWCFIGLMGLTVLWIIPGDPHYPPHDEFSKMYKVGIALLMLTHLVTAPKEFRSLFWFICLVGGGYLGWQAHEMPASAFVDGRLEGIGGPDFNEANVLGAHFVCMGVVAGVLFLASSENSKRLAFLLCGALAFNGFMQTRSRGVFTGLLLGAVGAVLLSNRYVRKQLAWMLPLLVIGLLIRADDRFWGRMGTITASAADRDTSSQIRVEVWEATLKMIVDHPLGVGAGNFFSVIGTYVPQHAGRDAHNTYLRCLAELGLPGGLLFAMLVANAFWTLHRCKRLIRENAQSQEMFYWAMGLQVCLLVFLGAGTTSTSTYIEEFYIILLMPVALERTIHYSITISSRSSDARGEC